MSTDTPEPAVEFEEVEFSYVADTPVLTGVDATFGRGEFITIIGQNGGGKSTLVKHLNGLLVPDAGSVRVHDETGSYDTSEHSMRTLASIVGYVFQNPDDQIFHTSVRDEIMYGLRNIGVPPAECDARIEDVLDQVGLGDRLHENPFSLGKGERQRLAIASVLAMEPHIICVDEPTTGQDKTEAAGIMEILRAYNERGHTVIAITHDIALAAAYTDRVVVIKDGQIIADGPPERVFLDAEHLQQTNIRPPQITQLGVELRRTVGADLYDDMWLTVDDAVDDICSFLNQKNVKAVKEESGQVSESNQSS